MVLQNYATSFRYLDFIFGTDNKYRAYRAKVAAEKAKAVQKLHHELTEAEEDAIENRILAETEAEGMRAEKAAESGDWNQAFKKSKVQ